MNISYSDKEIKNVIGNLNETGFHCIENAFDVKTQLSFVSYVNKLIDKKGKRYFSLINILKDVNSPFNKIDTNQRFKSIMEKISENCVKRKVYENENLSILRVVTGKNVKNQKLNFHYDAYALTALIPIVIPKGNIEDCGHLIAFPNIRNIRSNFLFNFFEKLILQNPISRKMLTIFFYKNFKKYTYIMKPGNIYLFWGYRTIHANHAVIPDNLRATLLYHVGEVHKNSFIDKYIRKRRHNLENKNTES
ncbi:hypothetical protein OAM56_01765 [Alphaproteobacteria bacterium]|nr:hypothetical protein [Alphaproteobacteria bacterium]